MLLSFAFNLLADCSSLTSRFAFLQMHAPDDSGNKTSASPTCSGAGQKHAGKRRKSAPSASASAGSKGQKQQPAKTPLSPSQPSKSKRGRQPESCPLKGEGKEHGPCLLCWCPNHMAVLLASVKGLTQTLLGVTYCSLLFQGSHTVHCSSRSPILFTALLGVPYCSLLFCI